MNEEITPYSMDEILSKWKQALEEIERQSEILKSLDFGYDIRFIKT